MSRPVSKRLLFDLIAEVAKSLGQGRRLEILELAAQGEPSVETVARRLGLSVANASQHLRHLMRAGLLTARRDRRRVRYGLSDPAIVGLLAELRRVAERNLAEVRSAVADYAGGDGAMGPISRAELAKGIRSGLVTVLDVRPEDEYVAGHLPRAVNIPSDRLARRIGALPKGREVVAYCRGPYCLLALEAIALLRRRGFSARRLEDGFPEWKAAGLPVAAGATRSFSASTPSRGVGPRGFPRAS